MNMPGLDMTKLSEIEEVDQEEESGRKQAPASTTNA
jgi:hypothetical protein